MYKYLHNYTSETEVNINITVNNGSEKSLKYTATLLQPILPCFQHTVHNRRISYDNNSLCSSYDYCSVAYRSNYRVKFKTYSKRSKVYVRGNESDLKKYKTVEIKNRYCQSSPSTKSKTKVYNTDCI
jgi:hypothetical protein